MSEARPPRLLDRVRHAARLRHLSRRTEEAYLGWIRRFIGYHGRRHPAEMGASEVVAFLSYLAVTRCVAAPTQNQALSALLFLYRVVLDRPLEWLDAVRAHTPRAIPVVLSRDELRAVLAQLAPRNRLFATLLYGGGLRLLEGLRLRVKDLDLQRRQVLVRQGKGGRDRRCPLPVRLRRPLLEHLERIQRIQERDRRSGIGVPLHDGLARKYPNAAAEWGWYWLFPARRTTVHREIRREISSIQTYPKRTLAPSRRESLPAAPTTSPQLPPAKMPSSSSTLFGPSSLPHRSISLSSVVRSTPTPLIPRRECLHAAQQGVGADRPAPYRLIAAW